MKLSSTHPTNIFKNLNRKAHLLILLFTSFLVYNCQDTILERYKASVPVYMSYEDLRKSVKQTGTQPLENPGKIYFKDNFIFINEHFKGIHIIDNQDPVHPTEIAFINIPGNVDIAIKENTLYADSYIDLVALDISNMNDIKETYRIEDVFPYAVPPKEVENIEGWIDQTKGVVIRWDVKEIEKEINEPHPYPGPYYYEYYKDYSFRDVNLANSSTAPSGAGSSSVGVGGSMARFAIQNNALYVLTGFQIKVLDISNINAPLTLKTLSSNSVETIFLKDNFMYIGASSGMYIYNISNNLDPLLVSTYNHFTACDPVIVEGDYAYVTLRSGRICRNNITNQLDVIDIKDKTAPKLVKSYTFTSPNGLGIDNGTLFICDGDDGLKVFNASNVNQITQNKIAEFKNIQATDVIPVNGLLFMIGNDGFYQYDYSNLTNISLVSKIEVTKK